MEEHALTDSEYTKYQSLIYQLSGISLHDGKRQLVQSRLQKRLRFFGFSTFTQYYDLIAATKDGDDERSEFINCITTNKTDFFREPHHFDFVRDTIVPELAQKAQRDRHPPRLRVWHAGCSTGEEPYTLAITLNEATKGRSDWDIKQLASDIDTNVLEHAERGVYAADRVAPIPADRLSRYFLRGKPNGQEMYMVKPILRNWLTFRQINLMEEPWPIRDDVRFDIIFCRNVVIYFDKPTQKKLFLRFEHLLRPGGYLFLGHSESLFGNGEDFDSVGHTIYRLRESSS